MNLFESPGFEPWTATTFAGFDVHLLRRENYAELNGAVVWIRKVSMVGSVFPLGMQPVGVELGISLEAAPTAEQSRKLQESFERTISEPVTVEVQNSLIKFRVAPCKPEVVVARLRALIELGAQLGLQVEQHRQ